MSNQTIVLALKQQVDAYRDLSKLAEVQHEHVQNSRTEDLLDVLRQRQMVLDRIAAMEETIVPARRRWKEFLDELEPDDRRSAEQMLAESRRLLELVTSADRNDTLVLQQRKLNVGRQIRQAEVARTVNHKYSTAAYGARPSKLNVQS